VPDSVPANDKKEETLKLEAVVSFVSSHATKTISGIATHPKQRDDLIRAFSRKVISQVLALNFPTANFKSFGKHGSLSDLRNFLERTAKPVGV